MSKIDLHIHSTASDGKLTSKEIVILAKAKGINYISITDHNVIGEVDMALEEGSRMGVKVIPGVELSTRYKGKQVHLLGYFIKENSYKDKLLSETLFWIRKKRLDKLKELWGDEIKVRKGAKRLDTVEGIKLLKKFKAKVFIAHPGKIYEKYIEEILKIGIDGIEAIHPRHSEYDRKKFIELAKKYKIKYSAGSDFHDLSKKNLKHGILGEVYREIHDIKEIF